MSLTQITENLAAVRARIEQAAVTCGRDPREITLLAVSKYQPVERLQAAIVAGQQAFGESYVQEALDKQAGLTDAPLDWHFVGRIQSNKTALIAAHFDWVHGLCDARHAQRLAQQRPAEHPPLRACIQVNLSGESSKAGILPAQLGELLAVVDGLHGLEIAGLMTLPAATDDVDAQYAAFASLRDQRDQYATEHRPLATLSMGMSDDLEAAIAAGATIVRIGSAIFGARPSHR